MTVSNAPPMAADAAFGISQATDASCLQNPCFYPGANAAAVQRVTWDVSPAQRIGTISETDVDVDIASLLNPLVQTADWQPGNAVLFKFTLIPPPPPPYDPSHPYAVHTTGLRVFEAKKDGYPKLTYTACTGGNCIPVASGTAPKVKTCKLDALSIGHSKEPECSYNGTAIVIGDQAELRGPQTDQDYTTSCTIQCCEGYQPNGVDQYRCEASGAWRDTDGGDVDVSCEVLDECMSRPCQNGGECSMPDISAVTELDDDHCAIPTKTNGHIFTCACTGDAADFTGDLCQSQTDDCASDPCHHGATCIDGVNEYTCNCAAGYNGGCDDPTDSTTCTSGDCENDIDECASNPCENGGHCHDSSSKTDNTIAADAYKCTCVGAWNGDNCATDNDNCHSSPCQNHGTCTTTDDGYTCTNCDAGWDGDDCDEDIDECSSHPCQNDGVCSDSSTADADVAVGAFHCECTGTYTGVTCTADTSTVNNCDSSPCQNGAPCEDDTADDGSSIFTCSCVTGFGGDVCSDVSVCNGGDAGQATCQNGGTCVDDATNEDGYTCDCGASGYNGARCETNTDDCDGDKNICKNGINADGSLKEDGTCVDAINAVACTCHAGFTGNSCEDTAIVCTDDTCKNDGVCSEDTSVEAGFSCVCAGGHTGPTCEGSQNFCVPEPCLNEGTCTNGDDGYTCSCKADTPTAGETCETCEGGKQPNDDQTSCENCPAGKFGTDGTCAACDDGTEPDTAMTACTACAAGKAPKTSGSGKCETCEAGHEAMLD